MGQTLALWTDWYNAAVYDSYVQHYPIYRELNHQLVQMAELETAKRVLDLACGSGATAHSCLERLAPQGELVGVDGSEAMVRLASARIEDPRARFKIASAVGLSEALRGPFDRAVCNSAIWQFPSLPAVLGGLGRILVANGLLVFNVPAERILGEPAEVHPFQIALARLVDARQDSSHQSCPTIFDPAQIEAWLDRAGFELADRRRYIYVGRQGELVELMKIPAMIGGVAPGLPPAERQALVELAGNRIDPRDRVEVPWIYFVARRRPD